MYMLSDSLSKNNANIVLHNDFINGVYTMSLAQLRIFKAMLEKVNRSEETFQTTRISHDDVFNDGVSGGSRWTVLKEAAKGLPSCLFNGEQIVSECVYASYNGYLETTFSEKMKPFFLGLDRSAVKTGKWTRASLDQIKKTKTFAGFRIYWLLKQHSTFKNGRFRNIPLQKLKDMLGMSTKYTTYQNFVKRVLEPVREELSETDMAFTYEDIKIGRSVDTIRFHYKKVLEDVQAPAIEEETYGDWSQLVKSIGIVTPASMVSINALLQENIIDTDYIEFVVKHYKYKDSKKQIKTSVASAVFSALTTGYLKPEYEQDKKRKKVRMPQAAKVTKPVAPEPTPAQVQAKSDAVKHWAGCIDYIKGFVGAQSFKTWFSPLVPVEYNRNSKTLLIQVPSQYVYDMLEESYVDTLRDALYNIIGKGVKLEYTMSKA